MVDLDAVRARWLELQANADPATEPARLEYWDAGSLEYRPEPYWDQRYGRTPRRRLDGPAEQMTRVGLDAQGRPMFGEAVVNGQVVRRELIAWPADDRAEVYDPQLEELSVIDFVDGRPATKVVCNGLLRLDGQLGVEVTRYDYEEQLAFELRVYESGQDRSWGGPERGPYWGWTATRFTHDDEGLALIEHVVADPGPGVASGEGFETALAAAAVAYERGEYYAGVTWDARLQRLEAPLEDPERAFDGLAAPLADAVHAAAQGWSPAFVHVGIGIGGSRDRPSFPPAALATHAFLARARSGAPDDIINPAYGPNPDSAKLDLLAHASPELLRRVRQINQGFAHQVPDELVQAFAEDVERELQARFPGVRVIVPKPLGPAIAGFVIGSPRRRVPINLHPASRTELDELLAGEGIPEPARSLIVADATWGIVLAPGEGESRLGGAPVLATGQPWPQTSDGRPLHHLATLALHELPDVEGRDLLPPGGHLSFFADLDEEDDALNEPIEPGSEYADRVAIVYTDAGAATHEPTGPALDERRVEPTACLQLRQVGFGSGHERYGLDALSESVLYPLVWQVNGAVGHQLLGFPTTVQDDPRGDGDVCLLHLAYDPEIDFAILDGGSLHWFGAPGDVRARRWERLTAWTSSC